MGLSAASPRRWSRRALLSLFAATAAPAETNKPRMFPSEVRRYPDPATEIDVYRLTDPSHSSYLPAYYNHALSRRSQFLLYSSNRTGSAQAFRMNLRSGESGQLTNAPALDGATLTLTPDERGACFFDGPSLRLMDLGKMRDRVVYSVPEGWQKAPGASLSGDGAFAIFGETRNGKSRLRLTSFAKSAAATIIEVEGEISHPMSRPGRNQVLYRQADGSLWLVNYEGRENRRLQTAAGGIGPARWAPDGRTLLYLNFPAEKGQLNTIREYAPDENQDTLVSKTSQFVHFGGNADASVFVGASRNAASPHLLLLLRSTRRELTLCEHHASDPAAVAPIFSPDSQRVFFQSDAHGKPAIYRVQVERFVERTESG